MEEDACSDQRCLIFLILTAASGHAVSIDVVKDGLLIERLLLLLAKDRALVTLGSGKALKANAKAFTAIVKAWIKYV